MKKLLRAFLKLLRDEHPFPPVAKDAKPVTVRVPHGYDDVLLGELDEGW